MNTENHQPKGRWFFAFHTMAGECTAGAFLLSPCAAAACAYAAARPNPPALGAFAEGHPGHPLRTPHPPV